MCEGELLYSHKLLQLSDNGANIQSRKSGLHGSQVLFIHALCGDFSRQELGSQGEDAQLVDLLKPI